MTVDTNELYSVVTAYFQSMFDHDTMLVTIAL